MSTIASVGVRELKNQAFSIVRAVREEQAEYVITVRNEPVAVLRPFEEADAEKWRRAALDETLSEMKELAQRVAAAWQSPKSGLELLEEQRR